MKSKIGMAFLILVGIAVLYSRFPVDNGGNLPILPEKPFMPVEGEMDEKTVREKDHMAAQNYIDHTPGGFVLLDESEPVSKNEIDLWEARITAYATTRTPGDIDDTSVHLLALKTASVFRLLKEASERQKQGLEPYTGLSGFNTMTLVMATEKAFSEVLGSTFSDFLYSLDKTTITGSLL